MLFFIFLYTSFQALRVKRDNSGTVLLLYCWHYIYKVYWLQSYKFSLRTKPFVAKITHYLIKTVLGRRRGLVTLRSFSNLSYPQYTITGQVLREFAWFVAFGGSCRYKLGKIWGNFLDWTDFRRNFAPDLRFTHKLVRVSFHKFGFVIGLLDTRQILPQLPSYQEHQRGGRQSLEPTGLSGTQDQDLPEV